MTLQIDTDVARRDAGSWIAWGDTAQRAQFSVADDCEAFMLGWPAASDQLAAAAAELWLAGAFVVLVADHVEAVDNAPLTSSTVAALHELAGLQVERAVRYSPRGGELGGAYSVELRSPFVIAGSTDVERGRSLLTRALQDTASGAQIRADEFEIVQLVDGRYLIVLPGVTDLSSPSIGFSGEHGSVRDLDQAAIESSMSTSVADNHYARMVWEALRRDGVPLGAELMIIGHSFGADTALDLATDSVFNGAGGYHVTHVVAAAYDSQPQLASVPVGTNVLVLQNSRDAAVVVEAVGNAHVTDTIDSGIEAVRDAWNLDVGGVLGSVWDTATNGTSAAVGAGAYVVANGDDLLGATDAFVARDLDRIGAELEDFVTRDPGTYEPRTGQVVAVFRGGFEGAGHHQDNYVDFVAQTDDAAVTRFLASMAVGTGTVGAAVAVDVSAR